MNLIPTDRLRLRGNARRDSGVTGITPADAELGGFSIMATKKAARKRELMEPSAGDKRFVRRAKDGTFKDVVDVGKSLAADRRSKSKTVVKSGQGDKGDIKRSSGKKAAAKKK